MGRTKRDVASAFSRERNAKNQRVSLASFPSTDKRKEVFGTQPHDKPTDQMYKINTILLGNNIQNHSILLAERFY